MRFPLLLSCTAAVALSLPVVQSWAADQLIAGHVLRITNPSSTNPAQRRIAISVRDNDPAHMVVGDPSQPAPNGGATLGIVAHGGTATFQTIALPQGVTAQGRPYWSRHGRTWRYRDPAGTQGPVRALRLVERAGGGVAFTAMLAGTHAAIDVVPPAPGTDATVALSLGSGERYCASFGAGAMTSRNDTHAWAQRNPTLGTDCSLSGAFDALTYNVAGLPEGISSSNPIVNTPLISPRLNAYDLVLVQESWQTPDPNPYAPIRVHHELLVADAHHPYKSISAINPFLSNPARPDALLADGLNMMARFPFDPNLIRTAWTSCYQSAADCLATKGFSVARTTLAPGVEVDIYDLHMEAGSAPEDEVLRDAGITQVVTSMQTYSAGRAVIIGGDFNLHTEDEPDGSQYARLLAEAGLTDACTAVACPEPHRIDKFAFRSNATITIQALSWTNVDALFRRGDGEKLSDHDPLTVRFAWTASAQ